MPDTEARARIIRRWSALCMTCFDDPKAFQKQRIFVEWESPQGRREIYISQWCSCPTEDLYGPAESVWRREERKLSKVKPEPS